MAAVPKKEQVIALAVSPGNSHTSIEDDTLYAVTDGGKIFRLRHANAPTPGQWQQLTPPIEPS